MNSSKDIIEKMNAEKPSRVGMSPSCAGCKHSINTCASCVEEDLKFEMEKMLHADGTFHVTPELMAEFCATRVRVVALEKVIERARYEADMARGEFMHLRIEDGLTRLDRSLNVLKFKDS